MSNGNYERICWFFETFSQKTISRSCLTNFFLFRCWKHKDIDRWIILAQILFLLNISKVMDMSPDSDSPSHGYFKYYAKLLTWNSLKPMGTHWLFGITSNILALSIQGQARGYVSSRHWRQEAICFWTNREYSAEPGMLKFIQTLVEIKITRHLSLDFVGRNPSRGLWGLY